MQNSSSMSFDQQIAHEYLKTLRELPLPAHHHGDGLDKSDLVFSMLVGQGIYNLAIMGMRLREERQQAQTG
jgi:hypothetical protein